VEGRQTTVAQYWDMVEPDSPAQRSGKHAAKAKVRFRAMLDDAFARTGERCAVGLFLSGGIDSSSLAAILNRTSLKLSTFSIVFREADYSEPSIPVRSQKQFRTDHHEIMVSQSDLFAAIDPRFMHGSAHDRRHQTHTSSRKESRGRLRLPFLDWRR